MLRYARRPVSSTAVAEEGKGERGEQIASEWTPDAVVTRRSVFLGSFLMNSLLKIQSAPADMI